jgi:hypothetical protein
MDCQVILQYSTNSKYEEYLLLPFTVMLRMSYNQQRCQQVKLYTSYSLVLIPAQIICEASGLGSLSISHINETPNSSLNATK